MNQNRGEIVKHCFVAACGLAIYAAGVYLTIQANIGVAPWDCFFLGIEKTFGIKYGNAAVMASLIIVMIDLLLKERIGLGTVIDAVFTGKVVDFLGWLDVVPEHTASFVRLALGLSLSECISTSLVTLMLATGNIRNYQIIVGGLQLLNLPLSYLLLRAGFTLESVLVVAIVI